MKRTLIVLFAVLIALMAFSTVWAWAQEATEDLGTGAAPAASEPTDGQVQSDPSKATTPAARNANAPVTHNCTDAKGKPYQVRVHKSPRVPRRIDIITPSGDLYSASPKLGRQAAFAGAPGANAQLQQPAGAAGTVNYNFNSPPAPATGTAANSAPVVTKKVWRFPTAEEASQFFGDWGPTLLQLLAWIALFAALILLARAGIGWLRKKVANHLPVATAAATTTTTTTTAATTATTTTGPFIGGGPNLGGNNNSVAPSQLCAIEIYERSI